MTDFMLYMCAGKKIKQGRESADEVENCYVGGISRIEKTGWLMVSEENEVL